jgi:hypothetical protein
LPAVDRIGCNYASRIVRGRRYYLDVARPALALILALAGCSLSISGPSSARKPGEPPSCDTGKGLVALDSLMAIGLGIGGLVALGDDQGTGAIALVSAALFTAAALHGSSNVDKCRAALDQFAKETRTPIDDDGLAQRSKRRRYVEPRQDEAPAPVVAKPVIPTPVAEADPAARLPSTPPTPKPPKPAPARPPLRTDDWSQFWKEVQP